MDKIVCNNNEQADRMLQSAKEFFHIQATREPYNANIVSLNLSLITAVQAYLKQPCKPKASRAAKVGDRIYVKSEDKEGFVTDKYVSGGTPYLLVAFDDKSIKNVIAHKDNYIYLWHKED